MPTPALAHSSNLCEAARTWDLRYPVGRFGFENKPGSLQGLSICLPGSQQEAGLPGSRPLPTERGSPCRSRLNLAWQRARVTGQQGRGQRPVGGWPEPVIYSARYLSLARPWRSNPRWPLPSRGSRTPASPEPCSTSTAARSSECHQELSVTRFCSPPSAVLGTVQ